jgi:hypothetical protein
MKNRAKCKRCQTIIESDGKEKLCPCGEISVYGNMQCSAKNWSSFIRVDDEGNEIIPQITDSPKDKPTKEELIKLLDEMISSIEGLPATAMLNSITHYDWVSTLLLVSQLFKSI